MQMSNISRRRFALVTGALAAASAAQGQSRAITAEEAVRRIQKTLGGEPAPNSPDGFKAGDPGTRVTGIATTAMATMDVFKRCSAAGLNLILSYEPTFFGRADGPARPEAGGPPGRGPAGISPADPVYAAKKDFLDKHGLVVFRLRDQWQARKPDAMVLGLAESLGWTGHRVKPDDVLYDVPAATAEDIVTHLRGKLSLKGGLRAVGDRKARVRRVLLHPGLLTPQTLWTRYTDADLIVAGEVREWENTFFAADLHTAGQKPGLVTLGRVASEEPGMRVCADWLKTIVPEVPARWIGAGDPYWRAS